MKKNNLERTPFIKENVPVLGSLGILALGDIGFDAWREIKRKNNIKDIDEEE